MPYPNEHAARLKDPKGFDRVRRQNDKFGTGIHAIFGVKDGKSTLQAIRFDSDKFTAAQAKAWLKEHDHASIEFSEATGKSALETEWTLRGEFCKQDPEQQMAWGWAYVSEEYGEQVADYSEEFAEWREVQKCAHTFVLESRIGDVMHTTDVGHIVDSLFFSPDIQKALGIDLGKVGWFIGYHVEDPAVWEAVKSGKLRAFSIGGTAIKETV